MSKYVAAITISHKGGALVAVERVQRRTNRTHDVYEDGRNRQLPTYESVARVVWAETLLGMVPEMAEQVAARLGKEPLAGDVQSRIDITTLGEPVQAAFRVRNLYPRPLVLGGERVLTPKEGPMTVPVPVLQTAVSVLLQEKRLEVLEALVLGQTILRSLEDLEALPSSGPTRDVAIATAIAAWVIYDSPRSEPWVSSREPPTDEVSEQAREHRLQAERAARASARAAARENGSLPFWSEAVDADDW